MPILNEPQSRAILSGFLDVDRRMAELEAFLNRGDGTSPFSGYVNDLSPTEAKVVQDHFAESGPQCWFISRTARFRLASVRPVFGGRPNRHQLHRHYLGGAEAVSTSRLRALTPEAQTRVQKFGEDLVRLVDQAAVYLRQGLDATWRNALPSSTRSTRGLERSPGWRRFWRGGSSWSSGRRSR